MLIDGYVRVSTLEQAREGYSIGAQTERLKAYCAARGWTKERCGCCPCTGMPMCATCACLLPPF